MIVYRIHKAKYDALDGTGAAVFGRRWNTRGTPAVYASTTLALARAEVGAKVSIGDLPDDYVVSEIGIDDVWVPHVIPLESLDQAWKDFPFPRLIQKMGSKCLKGAHPMIVVPSVMDPASRNVVLNPNHTELRKHVRELRVYALRDPDAE